MVRHGLATLVLITTTVFVASSCGVVLDINGDYATDPCGGFEPPLVKTCGKGICFQIIRACTDDEASTPSCVPGESDSTEMCDGIDNDCDGELDEDCPCDSGKLEKQPCYMGSPLTRGVGMCKDGEQRCHGGLWGPCIGSVLPTYDTLDEFDNDCNGYCDDPVDNPPRACTDQRCFSGRPEELIHGVCRQGRRFCANFVYTECQDEVRPSLEICNGLDDDCNGLVDDGVMCACVSGETKPCYSGNPLLLDVGVCKSGLSVCVDEKFDINCYNEVTPRVETCNGLDDDCNGLKDDAPGLGMDCQTKLFGLCELGKTGCGIDDVTGLPGVICTADIKPYQMAEEPCDAVDNNCDGTVDEGTACCPFDFIQSGSESDVNCGGTCVDRCANGKKCYTSGDCASMKCKNGICIVP